MNMITLITGGARSGKSRLAEELAEASGVDAIYLATMGGGDDQELALRINKHKARRPRSWKTIEEPIMVARAVSELPRPGAQSRAVCLLDCLSLFISNLLLSFPLGSSSEMLATLEENVLEDVEGLIEAMDSRDDYDFVVVTNEVGASVVPEVQLARIYRDLLGLANQRFAERAESVFICFAGLKLKLK